MTSARAAPAEAGSAGRTRHDFLVRRHGDETLSDRRMKRVRQPHETPLRYANGESVRVADAGRRPARARPGGGLEARVQQQAPRIQRQLGLPLHGAGGAGAWPQCEPVPRLVSGQETEQDRRADAGIQRRPELAGRRNRLTEGGGAQRLFCAGPEGRSTGSAATPSAIGTQSSATSACVRSSRSHASWRSRSGRTTGMRVWILAAAPAASVVMMVAAGTVSPSRTAVSSRRRQFRLPVR
jgi:hypothetical protein